MTINVYLTKVTHFEVLQEMNCILHIYLVAFKYKSH